ncbi:MAG: hypothetical protein R3Y08_02215 [Rikenellaceae bacterium]
MKNSIEAILLLAKYNFKVVFGGRYIVFMIISLLLFCYLLFNSAYSGEALSEITVNNNLIFPSLLLIFYPATYGIQKDEESKILEIFFCIPNYMYKVWLLRLLFVFIACFFNVLLFSYLAHLLLCPVNILPMTYHVMFVVIFFGSLAFFLSTFIKSGNGVAIILLGLLALLTVLSSLYENTMWDVMLNPFKEPTDIHPDIWQSTIINNRLLLIGSSVALLLISLNNLRRRESLL